MNNNNFNDGFNRTNNFENNAENSNNTQKENGYTNSYSNTQSANYTNAPQSTGYSNSNTTQSTNYYSHSQSNPYNNTQPINSTYGDSYSTVAQPVVQPVKKKKKSTGRTFAKTIAIALCFGLVAGGTMFGVNYAGEKLTGTTSTSSSSSTDKNTDKNTVKSTTPVNNTSGETTVYDVSTVVSNVMPSMVSINIKATATYENPYSQYFGFGYGYGDDTYEYETEGSGSGIIISENSNELLIVTNNHVVEGATEINVCFVDETSCSATIKGTDPDYDLAVISVKLSDIPQETKDAIAIATLGDSDNLQLGQPAIAIGNALGYGQSVTVGYISALEREVQLTDNTMSLIQTDAAINPGNSGGALLDMSGNVIGINSAKYSDTDVEAMGYAIPISDASPIIDGLINQTRVSESEQAYLGIIGTDVTDSYSQSFGLPTGIYITNVNEGSPADTAGIQAGDIITSFDGKSLSTMESLQSRIKSHKSGDKVEITVQRQQRTGDYEEVTMTVTLGSKSDAPTE